MKTLLNIDTTVTTDLLVSTIMVDTVWTLDMDLLNK
jgi:hypothetical protein